MSQTNEGRRKPRRAKKFRSQILAKWLIENFEPCRVADIGGGKGLLSYLLIKNGWKSVVIDPEDQLLPTKYTSLEKKKVKISDEDNDLVTRINEPFSKEMAKGFDLLVGLHAHGSNMLIIDACKEYDKDFLLIPCCVIDEPVIKEYGINWRESLVEYAESKGFLVKKEKLNFMGKDIAIYSFNNLKPIKTLK